MLKSLDVLKQLIASKTVWGLIILGLNATVLKEAPISEAIGQEFADALNGLLTAVGVALGVWGRLTARGPIVAPAS